MIALLALLVQVQSPESFTQFLARLRQTPVHERAAIARVYLDGKMTPLIESDTVAHFVHFGMASTVLINGDLQNGWSRPDTMTSIPCGETAFFHWSATVPRDTRADYQFIVDGQTITDPRNPRVTPSGYGPHSELAMPGFRSSKWLAERPDVARGSFDTLRWIPSDTTIRPRNVVVYRPAGYEKLSKLTSVYVHDGPEANDFGRMSVVLDNLVAAKRIPPVLAILIPPVERQDEYVWSKYRQYRSAVCDDLVPLIDRQYRTAKDPKRRGMMGISNGGHISLVTVMRRTDLFLNVAGQSSTITPQLLEATDAGLGKGIPKGLRVYTDVGVYDLAGQGDPTFSFLNTNRLYREELRRRHVVHRYREFNDGHAWANWRERTAEILEFWWGLK
jgi:enterochelin esterase family protein